MDEDVQKKLVEYQLIDQHLKQMKGQLEMAEQQMVEALATLQSLEDFSRLDKDEEILVPVNNGIFAKATLKKGSKVLLNVGASVVVDKSVEDAKKLVDTQRREIEKFHAALSSNMDTLMERAAKLEKELSAQMDNV